jgi:hypothetical protein
MRNRRWPDVLQTCMRIRSRIQKYERQKNSYAWIRPHRGSLLGNSPTLPASTLCFGPLAAVIHFFSTDVKHFLRL